MSAPTKPFVAMAVAAGATGIAVPLTAIFAILKATGGIAWPWLAVLSPLIAAVGIYVLFLIAFAFFAVSIAKEF